MAQDASLEPRRTLGDAKCLAARCFCRGVRFTVTIPTTALPLSVHICHCTICRYTHGTPCIFHAVLPKGCAPNFVAPSRDTVLSGYKHATALSERLFCRTCGCHIGDVDLEADGDGFTEWRVSSSIFETHSEDIFRITSHACTESSPGGGLYQWLPEVGGRQLRVWNPVSKGAEQAGDALGGASPGFENAGGGTDGELRGECHCGGVSFAISRPSSRILQDEKLKKLVSRLDKSKWQAILDICDDCRLVTGTHVAAWVFIPLSCISPSLPEDLELGTLTVFESTKDVWRAFCGVCGATVFYENKIRNRERSERVIDIATGILRTPDGSVGRGWFTWHTEKIAFQESGDKFDAAFSQALRVGFGSWGKQEYGARGG